MGQIRCPKCDKGLKVPESKRGAVVRCPGCKAKFRVPDRVPSRSRDGSKRKPLPSRAPASRRSSGKPNSRSKKTDGQLDAKQFLRKLVLPLGVVLGIAVLLIIGGFFSEYSSLAASGLLIVAAIGCIVAGRIWMAIDLGKDSVGIGIAALLVPLVGLVVSFRDKGRSLRGAIVLMSSLVFIPLLGLTVLLFAPDANGRPAFGPRAPSKAMNPEAWADRIEDWEENLAADAPVISASATVSPRGPAALEDLAARGDALLSRFDSYVSGSFSADIRQREVRFQFRGEESRKNAYAYFVGLSTNNFVRPE
ncbi:MAG: hypothetical protein AB8G99_00075 [Planctomycetaceae bacterium]